MPSFSLIINEGEKIQNALEEDTASREEAQERCIKLSWQVNYSHRYCSTNSRSENAFKKHAYSLHLRETQIWNVLVL